MLSPQLVPFVFLYRFQVRWQFYFSISLPLFPFLWLSWCNTTCSANDILRLQRAQLTRTHEEETALWRTDYTHLSRYTHTHRLFIGFLNARSMRSIVLVLTSPYVPSCLLCLFCYTVYSITWIFFGLINLGFAFDIVRLCFFDPALLFIFMHIGLSHPVSHITQAIQFNLHP